MGVKRCSDDTMHVFIDGEDMGPASTAVAKVHSLSHMRKHTHLQCTRLQPSKSYLAPNCRSAPCSCFLQNVYAVLDLYGRITAVSIVSSSLMEDMESVKAPSLSSDSCSEGEEDSTPVREVGAQRESVCQQDIQKLQTDVADIRTVWPKNWLIKF